MTRLRLLGVVGLAAAGLALAGCSGGSDGGDASADATPAGALIPPAEGASPELSATEAIAALGAPTGVSAEE
ncbi:MAG: FKBP-type peptidyl-prolyl cis-trans isomerase, partial [Miltoncostaeaceae bacterium]